MSFPESVLRKILEGYNESHPGAKISLELSKDDMEKKIQEIYGEGKCDMTGDHHWVACIGQEMDTSPERRREILDSIPHIPVFGDLTKPGEPWSSFDLSETMAYFEHHVRGFRFVDAVPLDFALRDKKSGTCSVSDLCDIDIRKEKKKAIGVIFNTHPHTMSGEHWIALYLDLVNGTANFYDSYAELPPEEIYTFMCRLSEQYESKYGKPLDLIYNDVQNQWGGAECGTLCVAFLVAMILTGNMFTVANTLSTHRSIGRLRSEFLSNPGKSKGL